MSDDIEELERRGWAALSSPGGAAFYEDLMADDALMVFPGLTLDKPATIRSIGAERPWSSFRLDDVRVVEAGDTAVISYHATAERPGEGRPYGARMSSVYVRRGGRWRLILHQQSPDPA